MKAGCELVSTANQYVWKYFNVIQHSRWTWFALGKANSRLPVLRVWGSLEMFWDGGYWMAVGQALPNFYQSYPIFVNKLWRTGLIHLHKWSLALMLGQGGIFRSWGISMDLFRGRGVYVTSVPTASPGKSGPWFLGKAVFILFCSVLNFDWWDVAREDPNR